MGDRWVSVYQCTRMPWKETDAVNERVGLIAAYLANEESFTELCDRLQISRKTGYKWVERYNSEGVGSLEDRSRAPLSRPEGVSPELSDRSFLYERNIGPGG